MTQEDIGFDDEEAGRHVAELNSGREYPIPPPDHDHHDDRDATDTCPRCDYDEGRAE